MALTGGLDLTGKVALVTGASRGLGFLLAAELLRQGCRVAICARDEPELQRAREALERGGGEVLAVACDVSDRAAVEALVARTAEHFRGLDVLVLNAGIIQVGPVRTMRVEDFEDALGVMFWGVVLPSLAALPHLRRSRGRIVTITSIGGKVPFPHLLPYNSAKFAAVGFSEGLAAEVARDGVRVTTVVPGLLRTGSPLNVFFKGAAEREQTWFTLSDSIPGLSMKAERAAARIVAALRRGSPELVLTLPAKVGVRVHGVAPGLTVRALGIVNRLLPDARTDDAGARRGLDLGLARRSRLFRAATAATQRAARRTHQLPGLVSVPPPVRTADRTGSG